jgi:hypothetical protein
MVGEHKRADARRETRDRRSLASQLDPVIEGMGLRPIAIPFSSYGPFGGSFHCATLDIRRRGSLQRYF